MHIYSKNKWKACNLWICFMTVWHGTYPSLRWRHNDYDGVSNHQPHGCLLNRLFRRRSKKTSKLRVTDLCVVNSPGPSSSPHKGQLRGKCFHLMTLSCVRRSLSHSGSIKTAKYGQPVWTLTSTDARAWFALCSHTRITWRYVLRRAANQNTCKYVNYVKSYFSNFIIRTIIMMVTMLLSITTIMMIPISTISTITIGFIGCTTNVLEWVFSKARPRIVSTLLKQPWPIRAAVKRLV